MQSISWAVHSCLLGFILLFGLRPLSRDSRNIFRRVGQGCFNSSDSEVSLMVTIDRYQPPTNISKRKLHDYIPGSTVPVVDKVLSGWEK